MFGSRVDFWKVGIPFLAIIIFGLGACTPSSSVENPTPTLAGTLIPYRSVTPSPKVITPTKVLLQPTHPQLPTPTPVTYKVVKGDTMLAIALRYGITLEALLAANPNVDPRFLSVDTLLTIPKAETSPDLPSNPTPMPLTLEAPHCYRVASENLSDGGEWCFVLVGNNQTQAIDNISLWIGLYTDRGEIAGGVATTPLNLLSPGKRMPAMLYFPPPIPPESSPMVEMLTAAPVQTGDERYLLTTLEGLDEGIKDDGLQADVQGLISLPGDSPPASQIWLVVVAYGSDGEVVGVRKWEANDSNDSDEQPEILQPGENLPFEVTVFSLGPTIKRLEVLVEARP